MVVLIALEKVAQMVSLMVDMLVAKMAIEKVAHMVSLMVELTAVAIDNQMV